MKTALIGDRRNLFIYSFDFINSLFIHLKMVEADIVINNNNIDLLIEIEDHEEAKDYHLFDLQCDIMKQQVERQKSL